MSCCGQHRQSLFGLESHWRTRPLSSPKRQTSQRSLVYFEYVGKTGLTVIGPLTGKRYRFSKPGTKVAVDSDDAPWLITIPGLGQTHSP
jgi:hypothetical protein